MTPQQIWIGHDPIQPKLFWPTSIRGVIHDDDDDDDDDDDMSLTRSWSSQLDEEDPEEQPLSGFLLGVALFSFLFFCCLNDL